MAPQCPRHGEEMIRCFQDVEWVGEGWERRQIYFEDFICPKCQFRLRIYYKVIQPGGGNSLESAIKEKR